MDALQIQLIKQLREVTGCGMLDCKKALISTNWDKRKAEKWLSEREEFLKWTRFAGRRKR